MAEVVIVSELLSLPLTPAPVVAGCLTFAVYGNDRLADLETDGVAAPDRTSFVSRHREVLYFLTALAYGIAVALAAAGGPVAFAISLLPGAVWLLYAQNWIPGLGNDVQRLKDVLLLNSVLVAGAWAAVIVFLPLAFADAGLSPAVGIVFLFLSLATFINTEIPNVRDMEGDHAIGVSTLPVVFGVRRTRQALYGVVLVTALILYGAVITDILSSVAAGALIGSLLCLSAVIYCLGRTDRGAGLAIASECTRLPLLVLVLLPE